MNLDARVTPLRDGIAARSLEGLVPAEVYLDPKAMSCTAAAAGIHRAPDGASEQMDQILFGERFEVLEEEGAFVLGQARRDGYVGYVEAARLGPVMPAPTHRVAALRTYAFEGASIKSRAGALLSINSLVRVETVEGRLAKAVGAGWLPVEHLAPIGVFEGDPAAVAERFVGAPYLWGGRESLGLDCSGLVQQALFACGMACPRDTDQQQALGREIDRAEFGRNDLVFWKGHVAMGLDADRIVHANGHHMMTVVEPLETAIARISAAGYGEPTAFRRL
ncbi:NlpC/P60 family protein [Phenylobacterium sp.]|uniref:C40 family peptidase n=1 Tax=Phenylobacterium sp. TaxID=1871053 RepID=UPI00391D00F1